MMLRPLYFILVISLVFTNCARKKAFSVDSIMESKIKFDLSQLDKEGLTGPEDGKKSIAYEFCIPDNKINRDKVKKIDRTIQFTRAMGRSLCSKNQVLCLGHTHQPNAQKVLLRLAELNYVEKIIETFYE